MGAALALRAAVTVDVHRFDLDVAAARAGDLGRCLSAQELSRAGRLVSERDRLYWTACRGLLRQTLASYLGCRARAVTFTAGDNGKPRIDSDSGDDGESPLHFNLSHSGDVALLAVSRFGPLGIDVEFLRPIRDWAAVAKRWFSPLEREQLWRLPEDERRDGFFRCWTRKEAVIKATGEGLSADLQAFDVTLAADARVLDYRGTQQGDWQLAHLEPRGGYVAALAVPDAGPDGRIRVAHKQARERAE
jgi:4'-phosphopantetheinyl transferase